MDGSRHPDGGHVLGGDIRGGASVVPQYGTSRGGKDGGTDVKLVLAATTTHDGGGPRGAQSTDVAHGSQSGRNRGIGGARTTVQRAAKRECLTTQEGAPADTARCLGLGVHRARPMGGNTRGGGNLNLGGEGGQPVVASMYPYVAVR